MPVKGFVLASLFFVGVFSFYGSPLFASFLDIKANAIATGGSLTGADRLERSGTERLQLIEYGLLLTEEYPLGTGLGHTYNQNMGENAGVASAHNGTISMLIELGVFGFTVVYCLMAWMFLCIFRNRSFSTHVRAFYFTFLFTVFGRSLSENYSPLDTGNFFVFIFLIFSICLFLNQKVQWSPAPGPPHPRGRVMVRPGMRPLLPRPVGIR
jgi:O-antigen ligase